MKTKMGQTRITDFSQLDLNKQYTYADYLTWQFSERVELIKGWIYKMSPAPSSNHQYISGEIEYQFGFYFRSNKLECRVYHAPFDVRLVRNKGQKDREISTVVQPDICVICDKDKIDKRGCIGAPDLVVEILSLSTAKKDYHEKFSLYEENGVREYWIVSPFAESVEVFVLEKDEYQAKGVFALEKGEKEVNSYIFPDFQIKLNKIFQ